MIDLIMLGRIYTKFLREMFQRVHARTPAAGSIIFQCAARYAEFLGAVGTRLTGQFLICTNDICYIIANSQINSLLSNSHIKNIQEIARNSELNNSLDRPSLRPKHDVLRLRHCEPVTDVTGVAIRIPLTRLNCLNCTKEKRIPTPVLRHWLGMTG